MGNRVAEGSDLRAVSPRPTEGPDSMNGFAYRDPEIKALDKLFMRDRLAVRPANDVILTRLLTRDVLGQHLSPDTLTEEALTTDAALRLLDQIAKTGRFPSSALYQKNTRWIDIYNATDLYKIGPPAHKLFASTLGQVKKTIKHQYPERCMMAFSLGVGGGDEVGAMLDNFIGANAGTDNYRHPVLRPPGVDSFKGCNIVMVDGSSNMLRYARDKVSAVNTERSYYDLSLVHADFTRTKPTDFTDSNPRMDKRLVNYAPRFVVCKGITSGNMPEAELMEVMRNYTRVGDFAYLDAASWDPSRGVEELDRENRGNYENPLYIELALDNWLKLLRFAGASESLLRAFNEHLELVVEQNAGNSDLCDFRFVYHIPDAERAAIAFKTGIELPDKVELFMSQRKERDRLRGSLEDNGFNVRSTTYDRDAGLVACFAERIY